MIGWGRTSLVGPFVGLFLPGRVATLPLVVFGSFAALAFRSLGHRVYTARKPHSLHSVCMWPGIFDPSTGP